jgi:microcystin-dependent protein
MPRTKISEFSATAASNTDVNSIDIAENCSPAGINDSLRAMAAMLKKQEVGTDPMTSPVMTGATITNASVTNLTLGGTAVTASATELNLLDGQTSLVPAGVIVMWSGQTSAIPTGWALCDGSSGTPNLTDKFIMGAGSSNELSTGGTNSLTIASANLPSHTHSFSATTSSAGAHTHSVTDPGHSHTINQGDSGGGTDGWDGSGSNATTNSATTGISIASAGAHTHTVSGTTGATGSGTAIDNRPAYMALAYIMKT